MPRRDIISEKGKKRIALVSLRTLWRKTREGNESVDETRRQWGKEKSACRRVFRKEGSFKGERKGSSFACQRRGGSQA